MTIADSRILEAQVFRQSLEITRSHGVPQASLKSAISLSRMAEPCAELGMKIDGVARFDLANVLWDQGEMTASIRMLQNLKGQSDLHKQAIPLSRSELLVTLVSYIRLPHLPTNLTLVSRVTMSQKHVSRSQNLFSKTTCPRP